MSSNPSCAPHGRTIRDSNGYAAFVPSPLPPPIAWNQALVADLSAADRAIGRLAGEGSRLRNPHLSIKPFVRREAVLSSRIEGTRTTLGELLVAASGGTAGRAPADLEEVANYVAALEHGLERLSSLPLSLRLIRELHERLMGGVRGDTALPGEFRHSQNWIGPPGCSLSEAMYVPPPPAELMACLDPFERMEQIDGLLEEWRDEFAGVQLGRPREVLRLFAENPFWTVRGVAEELGVAYTTAQRAVERLQGSGIVSPVGSAKRNRVYCARDMLAVLEAPRAAARSLPEAPPP